VPQHTKIAHCLFHNGKQSCLFHNGKQPNLAKNVCPSWFCSAYPGQTPKKPKKYLAYHPYGLWSTTWCPPGYFTSTALTSAFPYKVLSLSTEPGVHLVQPNTGHGSSAQFLLEPRALQCWCSCSELCRGSLAVLSVILTVLSAVLVKQSSPWALQPLSVTVLSAILTVLSTVLVKRSSPWALQPLSVTLSQYLSCPANSQAPQYLMWIHHTSPWYHLSDSQGQPRTILRRPAAQHQ
jgi:hypothetical protein